MEHLKEKLTGLVRDLGKEKHDQVMQRLDVVSFYPFNEYEFLISSLMGYGKITLDDYYELRDDYIARNLYMYVFEISAPRGFGEAWAQGHLKEIAPELVKPTKKLDQNYSGQYDFFLDGEIRIEVKASRAVDFASRDALYVKALSADSKRRFDMNFQQVKPACCDVFVWVGVWRDVIRYWVLSSWEDGVLECAYLNPIEERFNFAGPAHEIVIEKMEVIRGRTKKASDLIDLSLLSGEIAGALVFGTMRSKQSSKVFYYTPSQWKKSLPKDVSHARLMQLLSPEEIKRINLTKNKKKNLDILDACAIGLAHLKKMNRR